MTGADVEHPHQHASTEVGSVVFDLGLACTFEWPDASKESGAFDGGAGVFMAAFGTQDIRKDSPFISSSCTACTEPQQLRSPYAYCSCRMLYPNCSST